MVALRPILLIGLLVAGSGALLHLLGADEEPDSAPRQDRSAAARPDPAPPEGAAARDPVLADAPAPPRQTPPDGSPAEPEPTGTDAAGAAGSLAAPPAMGDHEPDAAPAVVTGRSRIEAGTDAGRSAEGEVLGRTAAAMIDSGQPFAERAASAEARSPEPGEPVARARVTTRPAEQASARDAVTETAPPAVASEAHEADRPAQGGSAPGGSGPTAGGSGPAVGGSGNVPPAALPDRLAGAGDPASRSGLQTQDVAALEERAEESEEAGAGWGDFGVTMLRRSIDRLFGWSRDQPSEQPATSPAPAEGAGEAAVAARDERAPASAEGAPAQLRSKSEASIRQAVRAMVALEEIEPAAGSADAAGERDQTLEPAAPAFDIVRVEPTGSAVLAGRAAPGAEVEVRAGDEVIDRVKADRSGAWVSTPATPIPAGDQTLSLAALKDDGTVLRSEDVVVVAIRDSQPPAAVATPEPPPPQPPTQVVAEAPPPQPAEIVPAVAPAKPLAVLLPGRGKGRILQAPGRIGSNGELALNVLDYDRSGRVELTGEAPPGAPIRIYVDNEAAAEVVAAESGAWMAALEDRLGPGTYTLRLDQLDAAGRPVARLETPFTRVDRPPREGDVEVDYVIVQPGNSLWRIARRLTGRGMTYVHIFDANRTQIRDPDLIYPGQVFEVPTGFGSAG